MTGFLSETWYCINKNNATFIEHLTSISKLKLVPRAGANIKKENYIVFQEKDDVLKSVLPKTEKILSKQCNVISCTKNLVLYIQKSVFETR